MNIVQHILTALIRAYRWFISPVLTVAFSPQGMCRYTPSCSEYAQQAIQTHGALRGSLLAVKRLLRCHPWGACGHDPVPAAEKCACETTLSVTTVRPNF